jgi:hypothetical protein
MRRYLWAGTVLALLICTVVLFLTSTDDGDYGWFAYTPDTGKIEGGPDLVMMSHARAAAWAVGALTLIALAAGAGYALGRRDRASSS